MLVPWSASDVDKVLPCYEENLRVLLGGNVHVDQPQVHAAVDDDPHLNLGPLVHHFFDPEWTCQIQANIGKGQQGTSNHL